LALGTGASGDSRGRGQTFVGWLGMGTNVCKDGWDGGKWLRGWLTINVCPHAAFKPVLKLILGNKRFTLQQLLD